MDGGRDRARSPGWAPMTRLSEGGLTPQSFVARYAEDPPDPAALPARTQRLLVPAGIPGANAATCVEVQDNDATLYREGELAETQADRAASDGLAIRMPGWHHEWAVQFPLARLPERIRSGKWRVYALVRVDKAAGADAASASAAFTAGVYDSGAHASRGEISAPVKDAGEGYHPYLLGTVATNSSQVRLDSATANPLVQSVWVDRIHFVPAD